MLRLVLRSLAAIALFIVGLAIVVPIAAYFLFDPNDFKPQISAYLSDKTGLPLKIEGAMEFTYMPWLGLKAQDITVEQFIQIKEMDLKIPLHDLLKRNLIIESLKIKDLQINLEKQANGETNWEHYHKKIKPTSNGTAPTPSNNPKQPKKLSFALKHFDITDAKIIYIDNTKKQTWLVDSLSLKGEHAQQGAFPVVIQSNVTLTPFNQSPTLNGKVKMDGRLSLEKDKEWIDVNSDIDFDMPNTQWKHATVHANIQGDLNKQIKIQDLTFKNGATDISGNAVIPMDSKSTITFSLRANEFDANPYLNSPTSSGAPTQSSSKPGKPTSAKRATANPSTGQALQGELYIEKLRLQNLTLTKVKTTVTKSGNTFSFKPFNANIFDGKLSANITHTLLPSMAPTTLQGTLSNLSLQPVLRAFNKPEKITGKANIDFNLAHPAGAGLNGIIKCKITNGIIQGVDVNYYLAKGQSLIKKIANTVPNTKQSPFNSLTATLHLHDNIIDNNDLILLSQDFKANGEGSIYLNNQTIEYKLQASKVYHDGKEHPNALPLAIRIKGSLENPKIEPDLDVYVKKLLSSELNQHLDKQLQKGLNKLLGDKKNEADVKDKIEKEVGKGLKKIFNIE